MDLNEHTISGRLSAIRAVLPEGVRLVAVSKFHPIPALQEAYEAGQRLFGENRPQEFAAKVEAIESAKAELNAQIAEMQTLLASRMQYWFG